MNISSFTPIGVPQALFVPPKNTPLKNTSFFTPIGVPQAPFFPPKNTLSILGALEASGRHLRSSWELEAPQEAQRWVWRKK